MKGFTLIEILVVIGILTILMAAVLVAVNPFRQFAQANNANRWSGVTTLTNAISQRIVDNKGKYGVVVDYTTYPETDCPAGDTGTTGDGDNIPTSATVIGSGAGQFDLCSTLFPTYLGSIPYDPQNGSYTDCTTYDTGYTIACDPTTRRITICAPSAQLGETICVTR